MQKPVNVLLFSHTHWDREWYRTFQEFRFALVEVIDLILSLIQAKEYETFILDGQTVVLEDYLEIRPDLKEVLADRIRRRKIIIGPWYILPDEFLVSGESLIRNLLLGKSIAEDLGKSQCIGYLPDMFGHISQIPQILKGFAIDKAVVWRGVNPNKSVFIWEGLDKSAVITAHLTDGYYNTFLINYENQKKNLDSHLKKLEEKAYKNTILFPNGGDHLAPTENLKSTINDINENFTNYRFEQIALDEYFKKLDFDINDLEVISGELRNADKTYILPGVFSTRMYLKQRNFKLQNMLTNWVEPLSSISWVLGNDYNEGFINLAWKNLLQNQPHDSICGCSTDQVHREMLQRFDNGDQLCSKLINNATHLIGESLGLSKNEDYILIYNMSNWASSKIEEIELDFPKKDTIENISLEDLKGNKIEFELLEKSELKKFVSEIDILPDWIEITRFKLLLKTGLIPSFGTKSIKIIKNKSENITLVSTIKTGENYISNSIAKISIDNNKVVLDNLKTNQKFIVNNFYTSGDVGDEYNYSPPKEDVLSQAALKNYELVEKSALKATLKITYELEYFEAIAESRTVNNGNQVINKITSFVTIKENDPLIYFKTIIDNKSQDHRLRVNCSYANKQDNLKCFYDTQFGILEQEAKGNTASFDVEKYQERVETTFAIQNFASLSNENSTLNVITKGLPEFEITQDDKNIYLTNTLIRAVGWLSRDDLRTRGGGAGPSFITPEAQCLGINEFEYSIYIAEKNFNSSDSIKVCTQANTGLKTLQFKPKNDKALTLKESLFKLQPESLIVSTLKRAQNRDGVVFRFYNPLPVEQNFVIEPSKNFHFSDAYLIRLDEKRIKLLKSGSDNSYSGLIKPFEIISINFVTFEIDS